MNEYDDADLRVAFRAFAEGTNRYIQPPGAERAQHVARGRVRSRRIIATIAVAVAVVVPASIVALIQNGRSGSLPMPPATSTPSTAATPTPTASPTPGDGPDGEPVPGPGALVNTTLTLSWPDPSVNEQCGGPVTIVDGFATVMVQSSMRFDVNGDGTREIVASIFCPMGQAGPMLLVAVRPHPSTPTILGTVLATAWGDGPVDPEDQQPAAIRDYVGLADGTIRVDVANRMICCGTPPNAAVVQQRTYRWAGSSFIQVGGPTTFVADPAVADLVATVPPLAFGPPVGRFRSGTLSVTITNNGPRTAADVSVYVYHHLGIEPPNGGDWDRCREGDHEFIGIENFAVCRIGDLAAGQTVTLTLPMRRSTDHEDEENPSFTTYTGGVELRTGTFYYPTQTTFDVEAA